MSTAHRILAEFAAEGGALAPDLFDVTRALGIVERCRERGVGVLGIEGFEPCAIGLVPRLDWIFDGSADRHAYDAARDFLESYGAARLHFEFTLEESELVLEDAA